VWQLILILALVFGGYLLSLKLNPYVKCSKCNNNPKRKGWVFTHAHHICPKCKGLGQQVRWGYKFFHIGGRKGVPPPP
jgi:Zn finger protein HypA/HybF involved in hydrogenase expression